MRKTISAIVGLGLLTMIPFVGIITIPFIVFIAFNKVLMFNKIQYGIFLAKEGRYLEPIETKSKGEFKTLSDSINKITEGLNIEVEQRLKAERLKTELISNVSHDIRTPLTSVITYIDLLKAEKTDNDNIRKYVEIIAQKADRLKSLTDDLFEASKAVSGNIPVAFEKVDVVSLITQGLGELNDKIKASSLKFKVNRSNEKLYVWADGRLLWRVIENLLSNVFKYSLENSRVYIDFFDESHFAGIEIKNISANELNIDEPELMERFKRGEESRSSPGSGLGLSIAKSLALAQKGNLEIKIDGDLFKATVSIPKYIEDTKARHN